MTRAAVPENFPVWIIDCLRTDGVDLEVDQELFDDCRRGKTETPDRGSAARHGLSI